MRQRAASSTAGSLSMFLSIMVCPVLLRLVFGLLGMAKGMRYRWSSLLPHIGVRYVAV
jgi:hypothetical protein